MCFTDRAWLCVAGEPLLMSDMAVWAVHYVLSHENTVNVELVHDWTMSWDECWFIYGCGIAWGDPVIDHKNRFLRLVEWLLPISHFMTLLECNALFAIVRWFHCSVTALNRLLANHQGRLPRIYLLYTENVDNIYMWKGSKLCQTILGLVSKLLHPLSVLLTIVLSWVLYHVAVCAIHIASNSILWGFCEGWREASRAAGVCAWTFHVMSHEWPCMLESICLLETYSREGDILSKSLVIVDLKTDRCNRSWDLLVALQSISKACVTSCGWIWVSRLMSQRLCLGTTRVSYAMQEHRHRHWIRSSMPLRITLFKEV